MTKIQSIVFSKKLWTLKECRKWLRQHKFKSRKVDEKKLTWRFRQTSPNKKYKYRTITLTKGIKAVVIVNKRKRTKGGFELTMPPSIKSFLEKHGNKIIKNITVCREPLNRMIEKLANFVTLGKFNEAKKDLHYDNYFHLFMNLELEDGTKAVAEKNQTVSIREGTKGYMSSCMPVPRIHSKSITLNEFIEKAIKNFGENKFFVYDMVSQNCQRFITQLLQSSGLDYPRLRVWVNQNVAEAIKSDFLQGITRGITDIARGFTIFKQKLFG